VYVEKLPMVKAPPDWPPLPPAEFELPLLPLAATMAATVPSVTTVMM
jgi:hypothetical protein